MENSDEFEESSGEATVKDKKKVCWPSSNGKNSNCVGNTSKSYEEGDNLGVACFIRGMPKKPAAHASLSTYLVLFKIPAGSYKL